jgi:hypothetical protein
MATPISDKIASATPYTGSTGDPNSGPVAGVSCIAAASTDALCVAGGTPSPYPGAALALGWSGVCGKDGHTYSVFKEGVIVATVEGTGTTDTVALAKANGVDSDLFGHILRLVAES